MAKVPRISGMDAVRAFERCGFVHTRTKGSHHILTKAGYPNSLSVPVHRGRTVGVGLLSSLIEAAGLTVEQFIEFLR